MLHTASQLRGYAIAALDGLFGKENDLLIDDRDWSVRFVVVRTDGWLTGRRVLVVPAAVRGVSDRRGVLVTNLTRRQVEAAPPLEYEAPPDPRAVYDRRFSDADAWPAYWGLPLVPARGPFGDSWRGRLPPQEVLDEEARVREGPWTVADPHVRGCVELRGYRLRAKDGEIGHVADFIVDPDAWRITHLVVAIRNWIPGGKRVLIAPEQVGYIDHGAGRIQVVGERAAVLKAPPFAPTRPH